MSIGTVKCIQCAQWETELRHPFKHSFMICHCSASALISRGQLTCSVKVHWADRIDTWLCWFDRQHASDLALAMRDWGTGSSWSEPIRRWELIDVTCDPFHTSYKNSERLAQSLQEKQQWAVRQRSVALRSVLAFSAHGFLLHTAVSSGPKTYQVRRERQHRW